MPVHQNLIYALKEGKITSIDNVESGLKCGCICPACGEPLVAKKGSKVMHHFAHHAGHNCEYGYETSLHLAAKDILSKAGKMLIPAVRLQFPKSYKTEKISDEMEIEIDRVELEQRFDGIVPDVVVYTKNKYFYIEIFVTHRVDEEKLAKLKKLNISTIEIDLSKINRMISPEELTDILLKKSNTKKWIYNVTEVKWLNRFKRVADRKNIEDHGLALHAMDCPKRQRVWQGRPYANVLDDCIYCEYCVAYTGRSVWCSGRLQVAHINDFEVPEDIRLKQREEKMKKQQELEKRPRYCRICGSIMIERQGRYGPFWGCSRYPECDYTESPE